MNQLTLHPTITMSSREIAQLTGKRHDHVLRDIRTMLSTLYGNESVDAGVPEVDKEEGFFEFLLEKGASPKLGDQLAYGITISRDTRGYVSEILMDHSHTMTLVSGYNVKLRKAIIDRWALLESQQRPAIEPPQQKARAARLPNEAKEKTATLVMVGRFLASVPGVNKALAAAYTLDAIEAATGLPVATMSRALPSVAPEDTATLNATQVGEPLGLSGRTCNALLEKLGLQYRDEAKNWKLTEAGTAYGEMKPFHRNGHSGYETRWKPAVVDVVRKHLDSIENAA